MLLQSLILVNFLRRVCCLIWRLGTRTSIFDTERARRNADLEMILTDLLLPRSFLSQFLDLGGLGISLRLQNLVWACPDADSDVGLTLGRIDVGFGMLSLGVLFDFGGEVGTAAVSGAGLAGGQLTFL